MLNIKSIKTQLIIYLLVVALALAVRGRDFSFLVALAIAVFAATLIETLILYVRTKSFKIASSPIITGMIIGYVLSGDTAWWKLTLTALVAIFSKYLFVFKKKHIFNPAAFGIFLSTLMLGTSTQWKGTYMWYVWVPCGLYFVQRINKMEIIIGYTIVSLALFGIQAVLQKVSLLNILGYFSYFYIFIMVIEPKTTPSKPIAKYIFGAGTAALIFAFTESGVRFDAELFSLLLANIMVPLLNKKRQGGVA
ncbi:MAG: RnfABCDGE type electron transport complex subunit D [Candidatus Omnitrophica bacterium]|nr:RnfABCDGE type electron transport complex subunit D [Candidatus Omnitrophota bacterium]